MTPEEFRTAIKSLAALQKFAVPQIRQELTAAKEFHSKATHEPMFLGISINEWGVPVLHFEFVKHDDETDGDFKYTTDAVLKPPPEAT